VVLSPTSRGLVPEDNPLCLGPSGVVGYPPASLAVREADLLIGIGSRFSDLQTYRWTLVEPGVPIVQVDLDPTEIGRHYPTTVGIVADARTFAEALLDATADLTPDAERRGWVAGWLAAAAHGGRGRGDGRRAREPRLRRAKYLLVSSRPAR
jgi:acetolactate synthase-1/2/3 large subunit